MKLRELVRHVERFGCVLDDEGAKHTTYVNLVDPRRLTTVPGHTEIADFLAPNLPQLGMPDSK